MRQHLNIQCYILYLSRLVHIYSSLAVRLSALFVQTMLDTFIQLFGQFFQSAIPFLRIISFILVYQFIIDIRLHIPPDTKYFFEFSPDLDKHFLFSLSANNSSFRLKFSLENPIFVTCDDFLSNASVTSFLSMIIREPLPVFVEKHSDVEEIH